MPRSFRVEAELPMDSAVYWEVRNSPEYLAALSKGLKLHSLTVVGSETCVGVTTLRLRTVPNVALPRALKSYLKGGQLAFDDELSFPAEPPAPGAAAEATVVTTNNITTRTNIGGVLRVEPAGPGRCRQVFSGDAAVNLPLGLGSLVENIIIGELKTTYKKLAKITEGFVEAHPEVQFTPPTPASPAHDESGPVVVVGGESDSDALLDEAMTPPPSFTPSLGAETVYLEANDQDFESEEDDAASVESRTSVLPAATPAGVFKRHIRSDSDASFIVLDDTKLQPLRSAVAAPKKTPVKRAYGVCCFSPFSCCAPAQDVDEDE